MTWQQFAAARRLLAEERVGAPLRANARAQQEADRARIEATKAAIRQTQKL